MCAFSIPRGVSLIAGGGYKKAENGEIMFNVTTEADDPDWGIIQSSFMKRKAKTLSFNRKMTILGNTLSYYQETALDIYGKKFNHQDSNTLTKVL